MLVVVMKSSMSKVLSKVLHPTFLDNLALFSNNNSITFIIKEKGKKIKKTVRLPTESICASL